MKTKNTFFLLVVAAAVGGAIYYVNQQEQEIIISAAIPEQSIPGVTSSTIQRVAIHAPGEKPVMLTRADDKWFTNVERQYAADPSAINNLLGAIDESIEAQIVSSSKDSFSDYLVDETSGVKVQVFERGKDAPTLDMIVGKDGPSAFSTYVRLAGEDDVLSAKASLSMAFKRPDGWRNKQIFEFTGTNATRIEATGTSQTFTVAREGGDKWMFETHEKAEAETARIDSMSNMLSSLRANEFIDPATSQTLADFGLEPPRQVINLTYEDKSSSPSKSNSVTLYIGNESATPGDWYAKRKDRNDIFTIGQSVADALLPEPATLMAPKPEPPPAEETTATATAVSEATPTETAAEVTTATEASPVPEPPPTTLVTPEPTPAPESTPAPTPEIAAIETTATDTATTTP